LAELLGLKLFGSRIAMTRGYRGVRLLTGVESGMEKTQNSGWFWGQVTILNKKEEEEKDKEALLTTRYF
jgi:hypothetical protein